MSLFLQYVTENGKFVFVPVTESLGNYDFPEINEPHIIAGFYENGQMKSLANSNITPIELYAMSNDVDFKMINSHDFHQAGRKFTFIKNEIIVQNVTIDGSLGDTLQPLIKDVLPDIDNTYDIGTETEKIKDVYCHGIKTLGLGATCSGSFMLPSGSVAGTYVLIDGALILDTGNSLDYDLFPINTLMMGGLTKDSGYIGSKVASFVNLRYMQQSWNFKRVGGGFFETSINISDNFRSNGVVKNISSANANVNNSYGCWTGYGAKSVNSIKMYYTGYFPKVTINETSVIDLQFKFNHGFTFE